METKDKRVKREIANSNERRRMQSINSGFQKLKRLLPVNDGEKLSKAAILLHASEFIQQIEREKLLLHEQNTLFRGIFHDVKNGTDISTAMDNIDLDALPIIPINTNLAINTSNNNAHNNSNDTNTDNNSIDDSIRSVSSASVNKDTNNTSKSCATPNNNRDDGNNNCYTTNAHKQNDEITNKPPHQILNYKELTNTPIIKNEIISDRVSTGVAKAAIALPLEVPYTSETAIKNELATTKDPPPKGQNLDTICKAIMEIEGDRVFVNDG